MSELLVLENSWLRVEVDPFSGGEMRWISRPGSVNALAWYDWQTPAPARASTTYGSTQLDWLSRYRGGWQELFPNAGAECEVDGVPVAFHGEASMSEWEVLSSTSQRCDLQAPARLPLVLRRQMALSPNAPVLFIDESVTNESDLTIDFLWAHHPVFPAIAGGRVDLPGGRTRVEPASAGGLGTADGRWPFLENADGRQQRLDTVTADRFVRVVYVDELAGAWAALRQPAPQPGIAMAWDIEAFPCLWFWTQNGTEEFPWYGRARMLALEPHTAAPFDGLAAARARGDAHTIGPRETKTAWLTFALIDSTDRAVTGVDRAGRVSYEER